MKKDLVFIASGGRTGTTFFGEGLGTVIEGCYSEHEPDIFVSDKRKSFQRVKRFGVWHMVVGRFAGVSGLRPLGHRYLSGKISKEQCVRALRKQRESYHANISEPLIVASSGRWWMFADCIHEIWPEAKLIGIIRDPRDWITSWLQYQPKRHTDFYLGWFPLGPLTPKDVGDASWAERWPALGQLGRLAWDWKNLYGKLTEKEGAVQVYRFEDLFQKNSKSMSNLVEFAATHAERKYRVGNLHGFSETVRNARKGERASWKNWSEAEAKLVDELCGPIMQKFGYGGEPEWRELVGAEESFQQQAHSAACKVA